MAGRLSSKKRTLESDEEDDIDPVKILNKSAVEQELDKYVGTKERKKSKLSTYVDFEEGIRFTPFNMEEELEEGDVYEDGSFAFNKKKDEIRDDWIEEVNWTQVKNLENTLKQKKEKEEREMEDIQEEEVDEGLIMKSMLEIMTPKETVTAAMKRLGKTGGSVGAWQRKKKAKLSEKVDSAEEVDTLKSKQQLSDLIGYADKLLSKGMFNIYQETYESVSFKLSQKSKVPQPAEAKDEVDIFGSRDPSSSVQPTTESSSGTTEALDIPG